MKKITGIHKSIRELFTGVKYKIHYYQREYQWGRKQIEELIEDLIGEFLDNYSSEHERQEVEKYGHYFMGSVVLTDDENAIIDGQQRLTSLSLLMLYIYKNLEDEQDKSEILSMLHSKKYGKTTFNINVKERSSCLEKIINNESFDPKGHPESVKNIWYRYNDIESLMIDKITNDALPYFKDWLIDNIQFIKIVASTEQDAHKIFVSMNDRGLSLTPTEMLKGYLLSEIADDDIREKVNESWKSIILNLKSLGKEIESDFMKTWFRSQYANTIRERKKNAKPGDFDKIGTTFHKWIRENHNEIGLNRSSDFEEFVGTEFVKFSKVFQNIYSYSEKLTSGFEYIYYNSNRNFTLQPQILMASLSKNDDESTINKKLKIVSCYLDQLISIRIFNYKTLDYSSIVYSMFLLTKKIRNKSPEELVKILTSELEHMEFTLEGIKSFALNNWTKRYMLHQLARITHFIEVKSGRDTMFENYVNRSIKNPYDIEHIWPDHFERFSDLFETEEEFQRVRNKFGGLLILPQDINRSLNDKDYNYKVEKYYSQNLLCSSLHMNCYINNPNFKKFIEINGLNFKHYSDFNLVSIEERQELFLEISKLIWNKSLLENLLNE